MSILRTRTNGMALHKMPLYAWYILVMAMMIVVGFPPLILGSILLELERAAGMPFFDVARGGDPVLWQHLFWLFGHPEVYIIFLPGAGIVSTLILVFCQRPLVGYRWVVLGVLTTGFISFGLWVHHMFTVGIPQLATAFFSAASMLVAIPTGVQIFAWLATLWLGKPVYKVPMLWLVGFHRLRRWRADRRDAGTGAVRLASARYPLRGCSHALRAGGRHGFPADGRAVLLAAALSGRMPSAKLGRWGFWLFFIGFNVTFLIMHWTGLIGMPRRVYTYDTGLGWDMPNLVSSIGSFIMAVGVATILLDIVLHFRFGKPAPKNPGRPIRWSGPPAATERLQLRQPAGRNRSPPAMEGPGPARQRSPRRARADGNRSWPPETWGSDPLTGKVREIIHLPGNSWLPSSRPCSSPYSASAC